MTLTEFLLARITEDEAVASDARDAIARDWAVSDEPAGCQCCVVVPGLGVALDHRQAPHVARWHPARVLAECAAKRAIINDCTVEREVSRRLLRPGTYEVVTEREPRADEQVQRFVLLNLAQPYADHPDFRRVVGAAHMSALHLAYGERPPWPHLTAKAAARRLGVSFEIMNGVMGGPRIRTAVTVGKSGARIVLLNREDIENLRNEIQGDPR
jgi:hypothetical protein